jgi:hypothetical protein
MGKTVVTKKDKDVPEEVMPTRKFTLKELLEIFHSLCSLDLECPQRPCIKGLVPKITLLGSSGNFKRWDLLESP